MRAFACVCAGENKIETSNASVCERMSDLGVVVVARPWLAAIE